MRVTTAFRCVACWLVGLPLLSAAPNSANRAQLEDVIFYQRLVEGGSGLAFKCYCAQERAFLDAERSVLAGAAAYFQALAALELNETGLASDALNRHTWDGDEDWQGTAATLKQGLRSPNSPLQSDSLPPAKKRLMAVTNTAWRDVAAAEPDDVHDRLHAAATWARTGQIDLLRRVAPKISFDPSLKILADGKVAVHYVFFDPAIFRIEAVQRTDQLYQNVVSKSDVDQLLIALWCEIYLRRLDDALGTVHALKELSLQSQLESDQIEELQCLGAALAEELGEQDQVKQFLLGRVENPLSSRWALRAVNLIRGYSSQRLAVMHQAVAKLSHHAHPLARQVLTNFPNQTEHVLDCYWEVAWGHRCQAIAEAGWQVSDKPSASSLRARCLVAELNSPTVAEAWRPRSALRLESILEANVLAGDPESWQLSLTKDLLNTHPILEPAVQLSRSYSALQRTRSRRGNLTMLPNNVTEDVAHLLLGDGEAARIAQATALASEDSGPARPGIEFTVVILIIIAVVVGTLVIRRRKGAAR